MSEIETAMRRINILSDSAGLSAKYVLGMLKQAVEDGKKKGLLPALSVQATEHSLAFAGALQQEAYQEWQNKKKVD